MTELVMRVRRTGANPPVSVLDIEGGILASDLPYFKDELDNLVTQNETHVIINMARLDFIGSSAIGTIMFTADRLKRRDGELVLVGVNDDIRSVFDHLGLTKFIAIHPTEQDAVQAILSVSKGD